jgi:hypothetical protein
VGTYSRIFNEAVSYEGHVLFNEEKGWAVNGKEMRNRSWPISKYYIGINIELIVKADVLNNIVI